MSTWFLRGQEPRGEPRGESGGKRIEAGGFLKPARARARKAEASQSVPNTDGDGVQVRRTGGTLLQEGHAFCA